MLLLNPEPTFIVPPFEIYGRRTLVIVEANLLGATVAVFTVPLTS